MEQPGYSPQCPGPGDGCELTDLPFSRPSACPSAAWLHCTGVTCQASQIPETPPDTELVSEHRKWQYADVDYKVSYPFACFSKTGGKKKREACKLLGQISVVKAAVKILKVYSKT